VNTMIKRRFP